MTRDHLRQLKLSSAMRESLAKYGIERLTPIQEQSLPALLAGDDVIGQAPTGTGKTLAFAVPLVENLRPGTFALEALVLCPTRELCAQVASEIRKVGRSRPQLRVLALAGGHPIDFQIRDLRKNAQIVVGTPGRVRDLMDRGHLTLKYLRTLVIDEADRMLDMGFITAITELIEQAPRDRQTILFSATFPEEVLELSQRFQKPNAVRVNVAAEETLAAAETIRHHARECAADGKFDSLCDLLKNLASGSTLVFCNFKNSTEELAVALIQRGLPVDRLHGDMMQDKRDRVMARFRNGSVRVLVATDVAARGLDVSALDAVVNYELPQHAEIYVHRVGRSGRAGRSGLAINMVTPDDRVRVERLQEALGITFDRGVPEAARPTPSREAPVVGEWETLCVKAGRKQKIRPADILGALTGDHSDGGARLTFEQVGKIEIQEHRTFVAVARSVARKALQRLRDGRIKGRRIDVAMA